MLPGYVRQGLLLSAFALSVYFPGVVRAEADNRSPRAAVSLDAAPDMGRAPAKFFTINSVLARLDSGKRSDAVQFAAVSAPETTLSDQPPVTIPAIEGREPFGLFGFRAPDGLLWRKWNGIQADLANDNKVLADCRADAASCPAHAAQLLRLVDAVKAKAGLAQIEEANRSINAAIRYVSDLAQFGVADRWSSALASFATTKGDCEDYAIAKYVVLQQAGFPQDDLRIVLVRDRRVQQDHAVLAARLDDRWLILDNRWSGIVSDSDSRNLVPLFALNQTGVLMLTTPYASRTIADSDVEASPAAAGGDIPTGWSGDPAVATGALAFELPPVL
ncbi:MAG: transglutaminase-like cysteine peptidase [Afipia sp.]|nr:transglutaminase-like cysteine peptidase [Afipia sp.]